MRLQEKEGKRDERGAWARNRGKERKSGVNAKRAGGEKGRSNRKSFLSIT